jgi:mono/diheme cytochrome c family protein/tRNA A-37 threonylcarbamoyl transferase component Bud32
MTGQDSFSSTLNAGGADLVGRRIGNFVIESRIGEGAMGAVYRGVHDTLDRRVAIKVLKPQLAADDNLVNRFIDEAKAASRLGHPNLVQVLDFGTLPDGRRYTVMEYLDGRDLEGALELEGPQPIGRVAAIGVQVASALAAAHSKGIVHRDIKPANIFLARDETGAERVKVLDFGIAKLMEGPSGAGARTAAGHIVGTPEYMAPEQAQANSDIDHRADMYSLGCVLYELLTGRPPHTAESLPAILVAQLQDVAVPPSQLRPDIPPQMEQLVLRCLEKPREARFHSMAEIADVLTPMADYIPPPRSAMRTLPPATQPSMRAPGTGKRILLGVLITLVIGGAIAAFILTQNLGKGGGDVAGASDGGAAVDVPTDRNPYTTRDAPIVASGKVVWMQHCAGCHGETGGGDGPKADPKNTPRAFAKLSGDSAATDAYRFEVVRRGAVDDGMPAFADKLSVDETWKVVTYIHTLTIQETADDLDLDGPKPKVTKKLIRRGREVYLDNCDRCHGKSGRGDGPAAEYLGRLPANLTNGFYKLRSTPEDSIPTDRDILRTLTVGVGTGIMPGFPKLPIEDRWALVAYVKTLSRRFRNEEPGEVAVVPPRIPSSKDSVDRGKAFFQMAGCPKCHGDEGRGDGPRGKNLRDKRGNVVEPPDFTDRFDFLSGSRPEDIWMTMYNGLAGVPMPMGQTVFSEEDSWHVINWILSLR